EMVPQVKKRGFASIIACAAGPKAKKDELLPLADHVVTLDTMDSGSFLSFFRWVSSSVAAGNVSMGASTEIHLPPPPPEVNLVF
ncbi:MAG TPA: tellurium resistance protein TerY, partial [Verrucomicrobium sp.]|nr:tellurium resistance protein TerY [Verrucomicrobium sp.]